MKFFAVILPLLAVLAQSAPIEYADELPTSDFTDKELDEIKTAFVDLGNAYSAAGIDPKKYYCADRWDEKILDQIANTPGLLVMNYDFRQLAERFSLYDGDFFCRELMDSLNKVDENLPTYGAIAEDFEAKDFPASEITDDELTEIETKFVDLGNAYSAAGIDPKKYYCADRWDEKILDQIANTPGLLVMNYDFRQLAERFSLYDGDFFCRQLMDSLKALE